MMATIHENGNENGKLSYRFAVKGASESVLPVCTNKLTPQGIKPITQRDRDFWQQQGDRMAAEGLRILAFAQKTVDNADANPYEQLTFIGIVGLLDPPRQDAKKAIKACQQAGIRVIC
jgi:Ca2+-transporting ATPase